MSPGPDMEVPPKTRILLDDNATEASTVLGLLVAEIQDAAPPHQYNTLRLFNDHWRDFQKAATSVPDCKKLVVILFHFLSRSEDKLQSHRNELHLAADAAFDTLSLIFGQPTGRHFAAFVEALKELLDDVDLTEHHLYQRPAPPPQDLLTQEVVRAAELWESREQEDREEIVEEEEIIRQSLSQAHVQGALLVYVTDKIAELETTENQGREEILSEQSRLWEELIFAAWRTIKHWESLGIRVCDTAGDACQVDLVHEDSEAERAGIQMGDKLLKLGFEGDADVHKLGEQEVTSVASLMETFHKMTEPYVPESPELTVWVSRFNIGALLGFNTTERELPTPGVYVTGVMEDGQAQRAGLQPNDRLEYIGGKKVLRQKDFHSGTHLCIQGGAAVPILVSRKGDQDRRESIKHILRIDDDAKVAADKNADRHKLTFTCSPREQFLNRIQIREEDTGDDSKDNQATKKPDPPIPTAREVWNSIPGAMLQLWGSGKEIALTEDVVISAKSFIMDGFLQRNETRACCVEMLRQLDLSGINTSFFLGHDYCHLLLPHRFTKRAKVFRDFIQCTPLPRYTGSLNSGKVIHIRTNIPAKSDIMYRFHVEGYNYGNNSVVNADVVGYTHNRWDLLGRTEEYGWPEDWDSNTINHYAPGATLSQYYSSDAFVTIKLQAQSFFCVGFSVSAWLVCHSYGADFAISATIHHQDRDL